MSLANNAIKGIAWTSLSTLIRSIVQLLQVAILTRYLTKSDFGIIAIATLFLGFTQIFLDLGISVGIIHKQDITKQQYSSLFWLNILMGICLTIILCILSYFVAQLYNEPELINVLSLLSLTVFFSSIGNQHRTVQQKMMRFKYISIIEIISSIGTFFIAAILAIKGYGVYSLVYSTLFHSFFSNILFLIVGLYNDNNISFHLNFKEIVYYLKIGFFSVGSQILDYISREIDIIIISATLSKENVGLYSLCKKIIFTIYNAINPTLIKVLTPLFAKIQNEKQRVKTLYYNLVESLTLINSPIYMLIAIFAYAILNILYGMQYTNGYISLSFIALTYCVNTISSPAGSLQMAMGRTDIGFYWTIIRIIVNTIGIYIGTQYGLNGLATSLFIVTVISNPIYWYMVIYPLIAGNYLEYFYKSAKIFIIALLLVLPFYIFTEKMTSIPLCLGIGCLYMGIYILYLVRYHSQAYIVTIILNNLKTK